MRVKFALFMVAAICAGSVAAALWSGDVAGSAVAGFTFLISIFSGYVGVCLMFVIGGSDWAALLVRYAVPVSFAPLALGGLLSIPAVVAIESFHRPEMQWFAGAAVGARAAAGCGVLLGLAWLASRNPARWLVAVFAICFILFQTAFSWDFGMTLQPHWHDTIFAPLWIMSSVLAGMALLVLFSTTGAWHSEPSPALPQESELEFRAQDFDRLGCFLLAFSLLHGYFIYAQMLTVWYGNMPEEVAALRDRLGGTFFAIFWIVVAASVVAPVLLLIFRPVRSSRRTSAAIAAVILIGLWLERLWLVLPARYVAY